MKRLVIICAAVVLSLFAVGCTKTIELTDEENYLVAEYAAELLMKYGTDIDFKYYYDAEDVTEVTTEETTEITTEEPATEDVVEATTQADTEVEGDTEDDGENHTNVQTMPVTGIENVSNIEATQNKDYNIASFIGEKNLSIKYSYYMLLDRYPSYDQDGIYIEIEAPAGYKLLVVKFNVENTVNEAQPIDLYSKGITYKIIVDDSKAAKQMLTILMDDLYTYQKTMEPSMFEEDVLLFQISDEIAANMKDLKLEVDYEGKQVIMQLQ